MFADVIKSDIVRRIEIPLDRAKFPHVGPDGQWVYFTALRDAISDVYRVNIATEEIENLTRDDFHDKFPTVSPDGEWVYYSRRISGYDKLYRLRIATGEKEQVTFGTFNDVAPIFAPNGRDLVYSSNEDDGIFNIRALDTETGDILQYTDVLGGNFAPSVIVDPETGEETLLFTSYYKGNWGLHTLSMDEPVKEIFADTIVRTPGPVIDFVPTVNHQVISENKREKGRFEKLFLDGPPPITAGFTSDFDFLGGTAISLRTCWGTTGFRSPPIPSVPTASITLSTPTSRGGCSTPLRRTTRPHSSIPTCPTTSRTSGRGRTASARFAPPARRLGPFTR